MGDKSRIEWTDATWSPVTGCTKVSQGCRRCYAERMAKRLQAMGVARYANGFKVTLHPEALDQPLHWTKPRRIFTCSMGDLFHKDVPDEFLDRVFAAMAVSQRHTYQVLTKRPERAARYLGERDASRRWAASRIFEAARQIELLRGFDDDCGWPLRNVWLGTSVEDQAAADLRIPHLLAAPAAVRFLSGEPLLGAIDLGRWLGWQAALPDDGPGTCDWGDCDAPAVALRKDVKHGWLPVCRAHQGIAWVIAGGESGPGARPMDLAWARSLRDQCAGAGVPFFYKQQGGPVRTRAGRELDGRTWDEFPACAPAGS